MRVRILDGEIPWDSHEVYALFGLLRQFPREVREYFVQGANPVLSVKIVSPDLLITEKGSVVYGRYDPCRHTIALNQNVLRGSWFSFPSEAQIFDVMTHELGHAYDRSRALVELRGGFNCAIPDRAYYSLYNEEYKKIIENGGNILKGRKFDTQEQLILENFAESFAQYKALQERQTLPKAQYGFFYQNVFCKEYEKVLTGLRRPSDLPFDFFDESHDVVVEATQYRHFCDKQ